MLSANVERNKQTVRKLFDDVINTGRLDRNYPRGSIALVWA